MKLMSKFLLSSLLLIPSYAESRFVEIKVDGETYLVRIDENRKVIGIGERYDQKNLKKITSLALFDHQTSLLELKLNELDYEIYELAKNSISNSKDLASRIKSLAAFFGYQAKIPWEAFMLKKLDAKMLACEEVWPDRVAARKFLKSQDFETHDERLLSEDYDKVREFIEIIDHSYNLIKDVRESTETRFAITEKELSDLKTHLHYGDWDALTGLKDKIMQRYSQSSQRVKYSQNLSSKKEREKLDNILERYHLASESKQLFENSYPVSLVNDNRPDSRYDSPMNTSLEVIVEKSLERSNEFTIDLKMSLKDYRKERIPAQTFVFNKSRSSFFVFYSDCKIGDVEESIYSLRSDMHSEVLKGFLEEIFPSGKDKKIVAQMDITESSVKKAIAAAFPGHYLQVSNSLDFGVKKIIEFVNGKTEKQKEGFLERLSTDYSAKEISIFPADSQYSAVYFSIPIEDHKSPIYLMINVGVQDWTQKSLGQLEGIVIEITPDSANEKREEIVVPSPWLAKIVQQCMPSGKDTSLVESIADDAPFLQEYIRGIINSLDKKSKIVKTECKREESVRKINSEIFKIRRKDYGWIVSEPFAKRREDGMIGVMTSFPKREYATLNPGNDIPNNVHGILNDFADIDFIRQGRFEKIGSAYCDLNISPLDYSYFCYLPAAFDDNSTHLEFADGLSKIKVSNISPLENIFVSTRLRFYDGKAILE